MVDYHCHEITGVPYKTLVSVLSRQMPGLFAKVFAGCWSWRGTFGWHFPATYGMADAAHTQLIPEQLLPAEPASKWAPLMEQLHDLNFRVLQYRQPQLIGARQQYNCLLHHESGTVIALLEWAKVLSSSGWETYAALELNSYPVEDPDVLTALTEPQHLVMSDMFQLPFVDSQYESIQIPLRKSLFKHQQRIAPRTVGPIQLEAIVAVHLDRSRRRFDWLVANRLLRKLTAKEVAKLSAMQPAFDS